jgi:hypothetical protein
MAVLAAGMPSFCARAARVGAWVNGPGIGVDVAGFGSVGFGIEDVVTCLLGLLAECLHAVVVGPCFVVEAVAGEVDGDGLFGEVRGAGDDGRDHGHVDEVAADSLANELPVTIAGRHVRVASDVREVELEVSAEGEVGALAASGENDGFASVDGEGRFVVAGLYDDAGNGAGRVGKEALGGAVEEGLAVGPEKSRSKAAGNIRVSSTVTRRSTLFWRGLLMRRVNLTPRELSTSYIFELFSV